MLSKKDDIMWQAFWLLADILHASQRNYSYILSRLRCAAVIVSLEAFLRAGEELPLGPNCLTSFSRALLV